MSVWVYIGMKILVVAIVLLLVWKGTDVSEWFGGEI